MLQVNRAKLRYAEELLKNILDEQEKHANYLENEMQLIKDNNAIEPIKENATSEFSKDKNYLNNLEHKNNRALRTIDFINNVDVSYALNNPYNTINIEK